MTTTVGSTTTNPYAYATGSGSSSSSSGSSSSSSSSNSATVGGLTMNDFLTLMTAQLQNQDPLNPTDSNQFLNQLSELSTVEGISQLNDSMTTLSSSMVSSSALSSAASMVGQGVLAQASSSTYTSGTPMTGAVQVPSGASSVVLNVTNSAGALVDQIAVSPTAGLQTFSWDGTSSNGTAQASGTYSISASANVNGTATAATTYANGTVTSVSLGASGASPTLNTTQLGPVALSSVQQID